MVDGIVNDRRSRKLATAPTRRWIWAMSIYPSVIHNMAVSWTRVVERTAVIEIADIYIGYVGLGVVV